MSRQLSPAGQKIALSVMCLIFISVGLALWIPGFLMPVLDWNARKKWKAVPCTIVSSPQDGGSFGLGFRYEVDGTPYEGRVDGEIGFFSSPSPLIWKLRAGSTTTCYVNPWSPREAVLQRDFDPELFVWCAPLMFVVLPLFALIVIQVRGLRPPSDTDPSPPEPTQGTVVLVPQTRRGCGIVLLLGFIAFFGGILALLALLPGFRESMVLRLVYMVPLGFVVLLLLRTLVRLLLRTLHPRLHLTVTPGEGAPGGSVDVRWDAQGSFGGIQRFRLLLEGREEVQRAKGRTDTAPFASIDVFQGGTKDFKRGSVKVRIPPGSMPSLTHGFRRIVWVFRLSAQVSGLPDLHEEYPYAVGVRKGGGA